VPAAQFMQFSHRQTTSSLITTDVSWQVLSQRARTATCRCPAPEQLQQLRSCHTLFLLELHDRRKKLSD
jgi:hypothetical protein